MFLVICGIDVDDRSLNGMEYGAEGASMLQLRDFCNCQGMATEIRKFRADEIQAMPLPAIWQSRQALNKYHYFVVYGIDESGIYALDGTTGVKMRPKQDRIEDFFTGFALVRKRSWIGHLMTKILASWLLVWLLIGLNVVLLGVFFLPCQRTVTDSLRKLVGVAVFVFMLGANNGQAVNGPSGADFAQGHRPGNGEVWRDEEHGGFNAVYFLLKVCGDVQDYDGALTKMQGLRLPQTLAEVLATGRQLGTPLQARFLSPDQLDNHPLPVIVHVEGDNLSEGCFCVLLQDQGQRLVFLDGPSGTICTIDRESFLRRWSGVAVSPCSRFWWIDASQVMFGVISGLFLARLWHRRRGYVKV